MGVFSLVRELWKYSEWNCQGYPWAMSPDSLKSTQMPTVRHFCTCGEGSPTFPRKARYIHQKLSLDAPGLECSTYHYLMVFELWDRISSYHLPVVQLSTCTFLPNNSQSLEPRALPQDVPSLHWFSRLTYSDTKVEVPRDSRTRLGNLTVSVRKITCHNHHTLNNICWVSEQNNRESTLGKTTLRISGQLCGILQRGIIHTRYVKQIIFTITKPNLLFDTNNWDKLIYIIQGKRKEVWLSFLMCIKGTVV